MIFELVVSSVESCAVDNSSEKDCFVFLGFIFKNFCKLFCLYFANIANASKKVKILFQNNMNLFEYGHYSYKVYIKIVLIKRLPISP